mmetsp:Transcript_27217/g.65146  ORF Transcript_27217/g.65146 Transcript_27217/m.65146 type:complete len:289 (-) Transcript_27217:1141-2007(-)
MNQLQRRHEDNIVGNDGDDDDMFVPFLQDEIEVEDQFVLDGHNNPDPNLARRMIQPALIEDDYQSDDGSRNVTNNYDDRDDLYEHGPETDDQERLNGSSEHTDRSSFYCYDHDKSTTFSTYHTNHHRNGWYIASIILKIISIISATICTTTVFWMSMFEHHVDSDFLDPMEYVTDTAGGILLFLDLLAVPFMAWAGDFVVIVLGSKSRIGDIEERGANILKFVSILLYFISLLFTAGVIYYSDSTTNTLLVLLYVLLSNLSWVLMFAYVELYPRSPLSKASHPVSFRK